MLDVILVKEVQDPDVLEAYFLQCLYWSLGAGLLEEGRIKFDKYVKYLASMSSVVDDEKTQAGPGKVIFI